MGSAIDYKLKTILCNKPVSNLPRGKRMVISALQNISCNEKIKNNNNQDNLPSTDEPEDNILSSNNISELVVASDQDIENICSQVLDQLDKLVSTDEEEPKNRTENNIEYQASCSPLKDKTNIEELFSMDAVSENTKEFMEDVNLSPRGKNDDPEYLPIQEIQNINSDSDSTDNKNISTHPVADIKENVEMSSSRMRKRKAEASEWPRNKIKNLRVSGKEYKGYKRNKDGKVIDGIPRPERKMGEICNSVACKKSKYHFCQIFSHEQRRSIFDKFWNNMDSWEKKKLFVRGNVEYIQTKRQSTGGPSRRKGTYIYYLRTKDNNRQRVCKRMFLSTLGLKEDMVHAWIANTEHGINIDKMENPQKTRIDKQLNLEKRKYLEQWITDLPKLSSHYCRRDTDKLYLEQMFRTKADLYRIYRDFCKSNDKESYILSFPILDHILREMNVSLYKPKKDRCDVCCSFETNNISEQEYTNHIERKDKARKEKEDDKAKALRMECYTLTVDVQAVKICPVINASAIYYKTKLNCHNFTVYNLATHQCTCYWWNETEGDLSASTFASFLIHYIKEKCSNPKLPIIIYSDGCCYQNRNVVMANALFQYSLKNNVIIEQKFLEKGHTQMECDAVHSLIERKIKNRFIHLPSDYINITREARCYPFPIDTYYVTHGFFLNFALPSTWSYKSIRPGKKTNDPTVTDLRYLHYSPTEKKILFKVNFDDELQPLPCRNVNYPNIDKYPALHNERLKIKYQKFKHLQELKAVLPADCVEFYDNLPHHLQ